MWSNLHSACIWRVAISQLPFSRGRALIREKRSRKVLQLSSERRSGIFNRHFHSVHDSQSVTDFYKLFGALKNSPSVVTPVCGFFIAANMVFRFMGSTALFCLASHTLIGAHERSCNQYSYIKEPERICLGRYNSCLLLFFAAKSRFPLHNSNIGFHR